jgi:GT2 family glycosyltransferase
MEKHASKSEQPVDLKQAIEAMESLAAKLREQTRLNEALFVEIQELDRRLGRVEQSIVFRMLQGVGRLASSVARRGGRLLLSSPLHSAYLRLRGGPPDAAEYRRWLGAHRSYFAPLPADTSQFPTFSVLLPIHRPRVDWLRQAIESVIAQTLPGWQLCLAVDGELSIEAEAMLNQFVRADPRIVRASGSNLGIAGALNLALSRAASDYAAVLDQDDVLEPAALAQVAMALIKEPADLLYTDEDYIDSAGEPFQPNFKPAFSPEMLLSCMYMGHLLVISRRRLGEMGGFRTQFDGAQDYDVALRLLSEGAKFRHLPLVLYHWRQHEGSTAKSPAAKPFAHEAGGRAIREYVEQLGYPAAVEEGFRPNTHQVRWCGPSDARCSVIVASRTPALLKRFLEGVRATTAHCDPEIVVIHHLNSSAHDLEIERLAETHKCRRIVHAGPFNFSQMCNSGARAASGNYLVFVNDDAWPVRNCWLDRIAGHLSRPHVGVVGALLRYPDGAIQHAGIGLGMLHSTGHIGRFLFDSHLFPWINYSRDVSAVSGACIAIRREVFERLEGFDPEYPSSFNDVDLCLRVREAGLAVILDRSIELFHLEHATRPKGQTSGERLRFLCRWRSRLIEADPYLSPHLNLDSEQPALSMERASPNAFDVR